MNEHDDYMTPLYAWEAVAHLIPPRVIWEPFYGDGTSGEHLRSLGFEVIHEDIDFFDHDYGDIIVTNPPFSKTKTIIPRLKELNKPFIMIMPSSKICTKYVRESFGTSIQIIIPHKRINFIKQEDGADVESPGCPFDCFYYCYNIGLPRDIVFL
mmetsp:Transcript_23819/g.49284  ORF Transcript_23819/g.49284 Transcript_23819/m.49284 type:complete len:154 (-) Transcript_23819:71-532(-)